MSRPNGSQEQLEKRRQRAIELLKSGAGMLATAQRIGCARSAVYSWWERFRKQGREGLAARSVPGRPCKLNQGQKRRLTQILLKGALRNGYSTDLWTTRRVAEVVEKRFGVVYHPNHLWRLLVALGWSCQKPEKRARDRDEKAIELWKRDQWPHIKKRRQAKSPSGFYRREWVPAHP